MGVPFDPPPGTGGVLFRTWTQDVSDTAQDHEARIILLEDEGGDSAVTSVNGHTGTVALTQDDIPDGTTAKKYTATEKTKLAGVAPGATANDTDANLKARANHTGTQPASTISDFTAAVTAFRLDQMAAPTNDVGLNGHKITGLADGVSSSDAATVGQLSAIGAGKSLKDPVLWSTTGNITLSGLGTQGGGEWTGALTAGDRILVKNQSSAAANGVYIAASGAWARSADANTPALVTLATVLILNGATLKGDVYAQSATVTTIGTDAQTWSKVGEGNTIYDADGSSILLTGITFSRAALTGDITAPAGSSVTTLATVNGNVGQFGSASTVSRPTVNAKGLVTAIDTVSIVVAQAAVTGLTASLAAKADDSAVVHLSGNETVAGIKTFSSVARAADAAAATDLMNRQSADARYEKLRGPDSVASSATPTINTDTTDGFDITALATAITSMTTNLSGSPANFDTLTIRIKDNGTSRAIAWGSKYYEAAGVALPTATVVSKEMTLGFRYNSTRSKWGLVALINEA